MFVEHSRCKARVASICLKALSLGLMMSVPSQSNAHGNSSPAADAPATSGEASEDRADQPVRSLEEALERAYESNPELLAQYAKLESVGYRLPQARARSGPQLSFEASYGYQRDNVEQLLGNFVKRSDWSTAASAILTQPLFTFGRNAAGEREAKAQIAYQRAAVQATEQQLVAQTFAAYVSVIRDRAAENIARENLQLLERELRNNASRYRARDTTRTDVQQVATRVELGRAQLLQAQRSVAASEALFQRLVGARPGDLAPPPSAPVPFRSIEDGFAVAQHQLPVMKAAYAREQVSRAGVEGAKAEGRVRVDLRGRAGVDTNLVGLQWRQRSQMSGQVVLSGSIFQSGLLTARVHEAEAINDADWRLIDQALRESRAELSDAWNEWVSAEASLVNLGDAVELARRAHEGAVKQEQLGMRTTLDVLDLARDLLSAQINYNATLATARNARTRVLAAAGLLDWGVFAPGLMRADIDKRVARARNDGDVPLLTPLVQAIDRLPLRSKADRPSRDSSGHDSAPTMAAPLPGDRAIENSGDALGDIDDYLDRTVVGSATAEDDCGKPPPR